MPVQLFGGKTVMHLSARCPPAPDPAPCTPQVCVVLPWPPTGPPTPDQPFCPQEVLSLRGYIGQCLGIPHLLFTDPAKHHTDPPRTTQTHPTGCILHSDDYHPIRTDHRDVDGGEEPRPLHRLATGPDRRRGADLRPLERFSWSACRCLMFASHSQHQQKVVSSQPYIVIVFVYILSVYFILPSNSFSVLNLNSKFKQQAWGFSAVFLFGLNSQCKVFWSPSPFFSFNDQFVVFYVPISLFPLVIICSTKIKFPNKPIFLIFKVPLSSVYCAPIFWFFYLWRNHLINVNLKSFKNVLYAL